METPEIFDSWAILELMGHRRLAGKVTEATIGGGAFIRIDCPGKEKETTQYYAPGAVYCITPTTEEIARKFAEYYEPQPVHPFEIARPMITGLEEDDYDRGI